VKLTHYGTATLLIEVGGVRLLTDPVFDPKGTKHDFGFGFGSTKEYVTASTEDAIGEVDAVLLSHDQHGDNLDARGREVMARAPRVLTTRVAAQRLGGGGGDRIVGLAPFESVNVTGANGAVVRITGTPARHGPPLSLPFVGAVTGFVLEGVGVGASPIYITGDTVFFGGVEEVAARFDVRVAVMHLGCASWGPLRFTMNAREAGTFAKAFSHAVLVPVHYDGWTHFKETRGDVEREMERVGAGERVRWLEPGVATEVASGC
jgi:L-ascorbate metabolism protein UlaG (beta-lactamase superfamily)